MLRSGHSALFLAKNKEKFHFSKLFLSVWEQQIICSNSAANLGMKFKSITDSGL